MNIPVGASSIALIRHKIGTVIKVVITHPSETAMSAIFQPAKNGVIANHVLQPRAVPTKPPRLQDKP